MKYNRNRKTIFGIGVIVSFALLIFSLTMFFYYRYSERQSLRLTPEDLDSMGLEEIREYLKEERETPIIHGFYLFPFVGFIGVLVGTFVYYILSEKLVQQEKSIQRNTRIILNFLTPLERKVIDNLLEENGIIKQYELTYLPGLNKVKTHRILNNLEQKGIIHREKLGKINKIILNKELYDILKE